jgi:ElaB/YqjD/DUF883 family membrane-anchored ribosome-binding protein
MSQATSWANQRENRVTEETVRAEEQVKDIVQHLTEYARENPTTAALWCFGVGFVLGWKLKPW